MRRATVLVAAGAVGVAAACSAFEEGGNVDPTSPVADADAGAPEAAAPVPPPVDGEAPDGGERVCGHDASFVAVKELTELGPPGSQLIAARLMPDEHVVYFGRSAPNRSDRDLYVAFRSASTNPFETPKLLDGISTTSEEGKPTFPSTRQRLYFHRNSETTPSLYSVWVSTKDPAQSDFLTASKLPGVAVNVEGTSSTDPFVSEDETELFFTSTRSDGPTKPRVWVAKGPGDGTFSQASRVDTGSADDFQNAPVLSADGLALYFGNGTANATTRISVLTRTTRQDPFVPLRDLGELDVKAVRDEPSWLSPDNCRLYFYSDRGGSFRIYMASR